ncbi:MAG TPA: cytochrome P450 [Blastocatellia bacterium]|nr:cytochrome P450 [Blastocatellia bacterium]
MSTPTQEISRAEPRDPIAAATHGAPYAYYDRLVAERPIYRDPDLNLWVASSAEMVTSVLGSNFCGVRPATEPVPNALAGSAAGAIFQSLVRMTDGARHGQLKRAVVSSLAETNYAHFKDVSNQWARRLCGPRAAIDCGEGLNDFVFQFSVFVIGDLLGLVEEVLGEVAGYVDRFVRCLSPISTPGQIEEGKTAAGRLLEIFDLGQRSLCAGSSMRSGGGLLAALNTRANDNGVNDPRLVAANGIGFFSQAYEGTAGLIGATLLALANSAALYAEVKSNANMLSNVMAEVLRHDSPVQNTRRFLSSSGNVAGQDMAAGDAILVLLAAANRDPAANPDPDRFEPMRTDRRCFTFGGGVHACPGEILASVIAKAAVSRLLELRIDLAQVSSNFAYRRSGNVRVPVFGSGPSNYL